MLKQAPSAPMRLINGLGVGVEYIRKRLARFRTSRRIPNLYQDVEVIFEQTICKRLGHRLDVIRINFQEIGIIALLAKKVLAIVASVIDVVISARTQGG